MPIRCAFGCKDTYTGVVLHVLPNPERSPERFKTWVSLIGGKLESPSDYNKYKRKRICDIHFSQEHRNRNNRLNALAVPTLQLPDNSDNSDQQASNPVDLPQMSATGISGDSACVMAEFERVNVVHQQPTVTVGTAGISAAVTADTHANLHKFPNPAKHKELFNTWVSSIGGDLLQIENDHIFKYRRVCHLHFKEKYCCRNNRLSIEAVPTRNMPDIIETIRDHNYSRKLHIDHSYSQPIEQPYKHSNTDDFDNEDSMLVENQFDATDDVTATAPREFSWQRSSEAIPCADDAEIQTDFTAPAFSGDDDGEGKRRLESHNERLHPHCKCNECGSEIVGYRYTCVQCCDVDLCSACEASGAHPEHYVLRLPRPEPAGAVKDVLEKIRSLLDYFPLHDQVKKEETDEEDPLSLGLVPPEPAAPDGHYRFEFEPDAPDEYDCFEFEPASLDEHDCFEFEEPLEEEESIEETTLSFENKFPQTDFTAHEDTIRHFPTDTARIQPSPDIVRHDVEDYSSVLLKHKDLSDVIPIWNNDGVVRPCEEGMDMSEVRPGVATLVGNVTWLGACVTTSGADVTTSGAGVTRR